VNGGPYDVTKILAEDPGAMTKPDSPLWGPMHVPHHWGESLFGYYLTDDAHVLRKHAQMLSDAQIDVIIFDVTNQITYKPYYMALLKVFSDVRRAGGRTPQVAFLCPFWDPPKVVAELYRDLYGPGLYSDLWFRWDGKPLILADPQLLVRTPKSGKPKQPAELRDGHTLGQSFSVADPLEAVSGSCPTWNATGSAVTCTLRREGPDGEQVASRRFTNVADNGWPMLRLDPPLPAGKYYLEMSAPHGKIGWWSHAKDVLPHGEAFADGKPVTGDRTLRLVRVDGETTRLRSFFTFRKPQPDYFRGPTRPDMWSWLEVYPQHVFKNARGEKEQMSVGVGQNAVGSRLATMSEAGARGRSYHNGAVSTEPGAVLHGYNLAEQWEHALEQDPKFIFVTGWNEWIAGRFEEFNGVRQPVMFVDAFDQEHSRDIEPMKGGYGDNYYYQLVDYVRRFKGVRPLPRLEPRPIRIDGRFDDWNEVKPEFRDTPGDPARRNHAGWNNVATYTNTTGRNDIVLAKVSCDEKTVFFYVRTRQPLTAATDPNWMLLYVDSDHDPRTGWLGYDHVLNRRRSNGQATVERNAGDTYEWEPVTEVRYRATGHELELAVPRDALSISSSPTVLDFKWADSIQQTGDWSDLTRNGDAAPNDRFNYRARLPGNGTRK